MTTNTTDLIFIIIGLIALIILSPIATILALNVLFNLGLHITWSTWFATAWLQFLVVSGLGATKSKK